MHLRCNSKTLSYFPSSQANHLKVPDWVYISKSIIEAHGGKIWAENNKGRGSTFIFTLPYSEWRLAGVDDNQR